MIDLKDVFDKKTYEDLVKCDFLKDIDELLNKDGLLNIDLVDLKHVTDNAIIIGAISENIDDPKETLVYKNINFNHKPNNCLINIACGLDISLSEVEEILAKIRKINKDILILYGTTVEKNLEKRIKVQALFTYKKEEDKEKIDKDLLFKLALFYVKTNKVNINSAQNEFNIGFNKTSILLAELENLGIVSKKNGTDPRTLLITDEAKIKELIYK